MKANPVAKKYNHEYESMLRRGTGTRVLIDLMSTYMHEIELQGNFLANPMHGTDNGSRSPIVFIRSMIPRFSSYLPKQRNT